jgi:hypothetical protein
MTKGVSATLGPLTHRRPDTSDWDQQEISIKVEESAK